MSARDDPSDPLYWPAAPLLAVVGPNPDISGPSPVWLVHDLPPQPWPALANGDPPCDLGPPGTTWEFSYIDLGIRYGFESLRDSAAFLRGSRLYNAPVLSADFAAYLYQVEERFSAMSLDLWRVSIVQKVADTEQSINVLHYIDGSGTPHTDDADGALMVASQVRARWHDAFAGVSLPSGGVALKTAYPTCCVGLEVRAARIRVTAQTSHAPVTGALKPDGAPERHNIFTGPPPEYLVPTQYAPFATPSEVTGTDTASLPLEVALCLSLGTGLRGGRNRGRTYLGPLGTAMMQSSAVGLFSPAFNLGVATTWKDKLITALAAESVPLVLVIASMRYATARPVTDVRVGAVPDSQRRRRRAQLEAYQTV